MAKQTSSNIAATPAAVSEISFVNSEVRVDRNGCSYITYKTADFIDKQGVLHPGTYHLCYNEVLFGKIQPGMKVAI